jgi:hypothetical protein
LSSTGTLVLGWLAVPWTDGLERDTAPTIERVTTYVLDGPIHHEGDDPFSLEHVELDLPAGELTPASEREEAVLERLVGLGLARRKASKRQKAED